MMDRITIRLPRQQVEMLEKLVEAGEFPTVSEAVRYSVRALLEKHGNRVLREAEQISFIVEEVFDADDHQRGVETR